MGERTEPDRLRVASDPRLLSVARPIDEAGMDGFANSIVLDCARQLR